MPVVDPSVCIGCGECAEICPVGAISVDGAAVIDQDECICCNSCVGECPVSAIGLRGPSGSL